MRLIFRLGAFASLALVLQIHASSAGSIPLDFVRALSSGDLRSFASLAEDPRQVRERDWFAVAREVDHHPCGDAHSIGILITKESSNSIEYRIDITSIDTRQQSWYLTAILTPAGWRVRSADDEAAYVTKRLIATDDEQYRRAILQDSEAQFGAVVESMIAIPLYTAEERKRAEPAIDFLLQYANQHQDTRSIAKLLSALARLKAVDVPEVAEAFANRAVLIAPDRVEHDAASFVLGSLVLMRDRTAGTCILDEIARSSDPYLANLALTEIANVDDEHYNFALSEAARLSRASAEFAEQTGSSEIGFRSFLNLGLLYRMLHSDEASVVALQKAVHFARQRSDAAEEALALLWLATDHARLETPDGAVSQDVIGELRLAAALVPPQRSEIRGYIVAYLGNELLQRTRLEEAAQLEPDALALASTTSNALTASTLYFFLLQLRQRQDRHEDAIYFAQESIRAGATRSLWREWISQTLSGDSLAFLGRTDEALPHYERAVDLIETRKGLIPTSPDGTFRYMTDKAYTYQRYVDSLADQGRIAEAFKNYERLRSLSLAAAMHDRGIRSADDDRSTGRHQLESELEKLNLARFGGSQTEAEASLEQALQDVQIKIDRLDSEHQLAEKPSPASDEWKEVLRVDGVLSDPHTALVEYEVTPEQISVFLVKREGQALTVERFRLTPDQKILFNTIALLRHHLSQRSLVYRSDARRLYRLLFAPIAKRLQRVTTLYFVPDAELWHVPFQILEDADGKQLIDGYAIAYAPSLVALRAASTVSRRNRNPAGNLLALGNPTVGKAAAGKIRNHYRDARLGDLPEAAQEVRALRKIYGTAAKVFIGTKADEATVKRLAPKYRVLHFASHGVTDNSRAMYSALLLSPSNTSDDGVLEAREIAEMHLNADLAVLSACDTASGNIYQHQGVVGLSWAFLIAGCPTTVASEWNTESHSSALLMIAFHQRLLAGDTKPQALRSAMLTLRKHKRYAHPFYWAPFVVIGAP